MVDVTILAEAWAVRGEMGGGKVEERFRLELVRYTRDEFFWRK